MLIRNESMKLYLERIEHSRSEIKAAREGPRTWALYLMASNDDTKARGLGSLVHTYCLDPHEFPTRYVMEPALPEGYANPRATRKYKEDKAALLEVHPLAQVITKDELDKAKACHEALQEHPDAKRLLFTNRLEAEVTIIFEHDGVPLRIRPDVIAQDGDGRLAIVDLKTCSDVSPNAFRRSVRKFGYDFSPYMYALGVSKEFGLPCSFYWVCVQTDRSQHVRVYKAGEAMMELSARKLREGFDRMCEYIVDLEAPSGLRHDHVGIESLSPSPWEMGEDLSNTEITFGSATVGVTAGAPTNGAATKQ